MERNIRLGIGMKKWRLNRKQEEETREGGGWASMTAEEEGNEGAFIDGSYQV